MSRRVEAEDDLYKTRVRAFEYELEKPESRGRGIKSRNASLNSSNAADTK